MKVGMVLFDNQALSEDGGDHGPTVKEQRLMPEPPLGVIGRQSELARAIDILSKDGDLMLTGVTGSGRRSLIRVAAQAVKAQVVEIDCLRATTPSQFLKQLADALLTRFSTTEALDWIARWEGLGAYQLCDSSPSEGDSSPSEGDSSPSEGDSSPSDDSIDHSSDSQNLPCPRHRAIGLRWSATPTNPERDAWSQFKILLALPQYLAECLGGRVVMMFHNFPHLRSWDRSGRWETYLRQEIQAQSQVSYVILATVVEPWATELSLPTLSLLPLERKEMEQWLRRSLALGPFDLSPEATDGFLSTVQGHSGTARSLLRHLGPSPSYCSDAYCSDAYRPDALRSPQTSRPRLDATAITQATQALIDDLTDTFETLLLLLPPIQARVLESLALDPTDRPHARHYLHKHHLSRGGGLQGALTSLEQKGLIYGAQYHYQLALPLLARWLQQRLA